MGPVGLVTDRPRKVPPGPSAKHLVSGSRLGPDLEKPRQARRCRDRILD